MSLTRTLAWTVLILLSPAVLAAAQPAAYVGSKTCADCHQGQYDAFVKFAKKAKSDKSIKVLADKLAPDELKGCYACHTTGYGKPGGFVSFEKTPDLGSAGCEVCHGPGAAHAESGGDAALIVRKPTMDGCRACHNEERVKSFGFKPLTHAGAH